MWVLSHFLSICTLLAFVNGDGSLTSRVRSSDSVRFLVMGDWGTQTSPKNRRLVSSTDSYHEEEDSVNFLESAENLNKNENGNGNNNGNNNNNNNNKNNGGGNGNYWAVLVAKAMSNFASNYPADFLLALGDNFYNNGVTSTNDGLWTTLYTNVYNYDGLQIPWYAIFGNHDYGQNKNNVGSLDAQVEFDDGRWHAGYCYLLTYAIPNSGSHVDIVFVDTTLIAPQETYMTSTSAGISQNTQSEKQVEQLECMEGYLAASTASFLLVAGHYPMFSTGKNGPGDMDTTVELMLPYFEKYNVDAYLCGHDHRMEHLQYKTSSEGYMDFIISGAAGKPDEQLQNGITSSATSKYASATGGFAFADVSTTGMTISLIDYTGTVLYSMYRQQSRPQSGASSAKSDESAQVAHDEDEARSSNQRHRSDEYMTVNSVTGAVINELVEIGILIGTLSSLVAVFILIASPDVRGAAIGRLVEQFRPHSKTPPQNAADPKGRGGGNSNIPAFRSFNSPPTKSYPAGVPPMSQMYRSTGGPNKIPIGAGAGVPRRPSMSNISVGNFNEMRKDSGFGNGRRDMMHPANRADMMDAGRGDMGNPVALSAAARAKLAIRGADSRPKATPPPPPPPPPPVPATTKLNKHISAIRNLHESMEMQRPSHDAIAEAIAQTAKRLETLGLPTPDVPSGQGGAKRSAPASVFMRPLRDNHGRILPSSNV